MRHRRCMIFTQVKKEGSSTSNLVSKRQMKCVWNSIEYDHSACNAGTLTLRLGEPRHHCRAGYARRIYSELQHKPFDRDWLDGFAEPVPSLGQVCDVGCGPGHAARYVHPVRQARRAKKLVIRDRDVSRDDSIPRPKTP